MTAPPEGAERNLSLCILINWLGWEVLLFIGWLYRRILAILKFIYNFYQKLGYEIFGVLDDFPPGYQRLFLKKQFV